MLHKIEIVTKSLQNSSRSLAYCRADLDMIIKPVEEYRKKEVQGYMVADWVTSTSPVTLKY